MAAVEIPTMKTLGKQDAPKAEKAAEEHRNGRREGGGRVVEGWRNGRLEGGGRGKAAGSGKGEGCAEQPKNAQNNPRMRRMTQECTE